MIAAVRDVNRPVGCDCETERRIEPRGGANAIGETTLPGQSGNSGDNACGCDFADGMIARVGDEDVSTLIYCNSRWRVGLRLRAGSVAAPGRSWLPGECAHHAVRV